MSIQCGNLGLVYLSQTNFDRAEELFKQSLSIAENIGYEEGRANHYLQFGMLAERSDDPDRAWEHWTIARDLFAMIGMTNKVEQIQQWLDELSSDEATE